MYLSVELFSVVHRKIIVSAYKHSLTGSEVSHLRYFCDQGNDLMDIIL